MLSIWAFWTYASFFYEDPPKNSRDLLVNTWNKLLLDILNYEILTFKGKNGEMNNQFSLPFKIIDLFFPLFEGDFKNLSTHFI